MDILVYTPVRVFMSTLVTEFSVQISRFACSVLVGISQPIKITVIFHTKTVHNNFEHNSIFCAENLGPRIHEIDFLFLKLP